MPRLFLSLLLSLGIASSASAISMSWSSVGNPGNGCSNTAFGCFGAVGYTYNIGTYEVTNAQYAVFLNAKAASDPLALYNPKMADPGNHYPTGFQPCCDSGEGGIVRSGTPGSYSYGAIVGRENMPVNYVSFYDALRFANWMNNGQGNGDTETGAYTLEGGTSTPSNSSTVARNDDATVFVTSQDEWFKSAYYDAASLNYFDYPTGSIFPVCSDPTNAPGHANCSYGYRGPTIVGSYPGSPSSYNTFDQGGNVYEWIEVAWYAGYGSGIRGGDYVGSTGAMHRDNGADISATYELNDIGFRLAMIPEPSTGLLVIAGMLCLAGWRRAHD